MKAYENMEGMLTTPSPKMRHLCPAVLLITIDIPAHLERSVRGICATPIGNAKLELDPLLSS